MSTPPYKYRPGETPSLARRLMDLERDLRVRAKRVRARAHRRGSPDLLEEANRLQAEAKRLERERRGI